VVTYLRWPVNTGETVYAIGPDMKKLSLPPIARGSVLVDKIAKYLKLAAIEEGQWTGRRDV
jgi:hypothetical protein